jgi:hypothetical protein
MVLAASDSALTTRADASGVAVSLDRRPRKGRLLRAGRHGRRVALLTMNRRLPQNGLFPTIFMDAVRST